MKTKNKSYNMVQIVNISNWNKTISSAYQEMLFPGGLAFQSPIIF